VSPRDRESPHVARSTTTPWRIGPGDIKFD